MSLEFKKRKLKNGITVLFEKRSLPIVSFSITNKFGASYESSEIKGIAHFIEHLLFTGTKNRSHEQISREIEKKGGILNAFTSQDMTSYWFKLPSEHLFSGIDILTDMLKNPKFDIEKFEKEKKVIIEEIKMYHDMPRFSVYEKILENLYECPLGEGIIGSEKTISSLKRDFVSEYYGKKYSPENYIVTIVGEADFEKICNDLEKKFSPSGEKAAPMEIKKKNSRSVEERQGIDQAHFVFGIHAPMPEQKEKYAFEIMDSYLANGMSSKLFLEIREKRGLAYAVKSSLNQEKTHSYYTIYVGTTKQAIPEIEKIILQEFKKIKEMTEQDLEEAKSRVIGLKKLSTEESTNAMNELMISEIMGKAEEYYEFEEEIKKVSLEDVKKMANIEKYSTAAIVPK